MYFRFNNQTILPENIITYCNQISTNRYIPIKNLSDLDESRLADKTFIKIIDLISKTNAINNDTWKQFGRICALMQYSVEYFDYFSKTENYSGENNINEYNKIYEKAINDLNNKDKKAQQQIEDDINYSNIILRDWIKELDRSFFRNIETQKYQFGSNVAAEYVGHPKSIRIFKNFCSSDNQFFLKFWLPPFSTMRILNPKVGTAPRKFEKSFWTTNRPRHLFLYKNIVISFRGAFVQIENYSNTVKRENFLKNFA